LRQFTRNGLEICYATPGMGNWGNQGIRADILQILWWSYHLVVGGIKAIAIPSPRSIVSPISQGIPFNCTRNPIPHQPYGAQCIISFQTTSFPFLELVILGMSLAPPESHTTP
jgi:hypothetical protein